MNPGKGHRYWDQFKDVAGRRRKWLWLSRDEYSEKLSRLSEEMEIAETEQELAFQEWIACRPHRGYRNYPEMIIKYNDLRIKWRTRKVEASKRARLFNLQHSVEERKLNKQWQDLKKNLELTKRIKAALRSDRPLEALKSLREELKQTKTISLQ